MTEKNDKQQISRWYDKNEKVAESMHKLEDLPDSLKKQVAAYLIEDLITKRPYIDMLPMDVHYLVCSENRRRRWYDFDESVRIFVELLRHSSDQQKTEICIVLLDFLNKVSEDTTR